MSFQAVGDNCFNRFQMGKELVVHRTQAKRLGFTRCIQKQKAALFDFTALEFLLLSCIA